MKKTLKFSIIYLIALYPFILLILVLQINGKVCLSYQGFAVDLDKNIYLGKNDIEVLDSDGNLIKIIDPMTSRGYKFTIIENKEILIRTGDRLYTKNLSGELISEKIIKDYTNTPLSKTHRYKYISDDGTEYIMSMRFFRTCIYQINKNEKILIYKMPLLDFSIRILSFAVYTSMMIAILIVIVKTRGIKI